MKKQLYRAAAATVLGLSLTTGIVAADTGSINQTGQNSSNTIHTRIHNHARVTNDNTVTVSSSNDQSGYSGDAKVKDNTTGGNATSGDVTNHNTTTASLSVDNSSASSVAPQVVADPSDLGGGSISNTGQNSSNEVSTSLSNSLHVTNTNNITVTNTSTQSGTTGDATVSGNTTGGDATSGSVSNTNSSDFTLSVTN